jgi:hypothetical protein
MMCAACASALPPPFDQLHAGERAAAIVHVKHALSELPVADGAVHQHRRAIDRPLPRHLLLLNQRGREFLLIDPRQQLVLLDEAKIDDAVESSFEIVRMDCTARPLLRRPSGFSSPPPPPAPST